MTQRDPKVGATEAASESPEVRTRVLTALTNPGNQRLLVEWLTERAGYEVLVDVEPDLSDSDFDIAIVDRQSLGELRPAIRTEKETSEAFLPVLLVRPDPGGQPGDSRRSESTARPRLDIVDEVLSTPIDAEVLERRLETLSRIRAQSVALERKTDQLLLLNRITRHDIRNEMNVIRGWTESLEARTESEAEIRQRIVDSSKHVVDLTDAVREFVDMLETNGDPDLEAIPLHTVLTDELTKRESLFETAEFRVVGEIPRVEVLANQLLASVFRNVLNNAVQHNHAETPEVEIRVEPGGERIGIAITDNGSGIDEGNRAAVLGRTDEGLAHPAAGVGLYLVETLVNQYGGQVSLGESPTGGLSVDIELRTAGDAKPKER